MILVLNHQLRLNGNRYWLVILTSLLFFACSPKTQKTAVKKPEVPRVEKEIEKLAPKFTQADISLLVPFRLNDIKLKTASKTEVEKSAMAIDFYQGFKLGLDSAAKLGLNFRLKVFDSKNNNSYLEELINKGNLKNSNLIVGPVFPDGLKHLSSYSISQNIPVVSPLAASHPSEFNNPNLISIANNVDLHASKLGDYINRSYSPENTVVVLINPKTPDDEVMADPIRNYFARNNKQFVFQEYASVFTMETKLIKNRRYVIVVSSNDRKFIMPTIDKLVKMKNAGLSVDLYGHPDWVKQNYNIDKLQALRTTVTASYKVDYTSGAVKDFIKNYRKLFNFEPGEYAFKGFDIGFYFGKLIARHGKDYMSHLAREKYDGLHNQFSFYRDEKLGYINTSLMLLRYQNFALNVIE